MTTQELDRQIRDILAAVTPETSLSAARALHALGFGARQAFLIVCQVLQDAEVPR
jgi:hypothetical protein